MSRSESYTLSLHDALPIWNPSGLRDDPVRGAPSGAPGGATAARLMLTVTTIEKLDRVIHERARLGIMTDRKSTRLNSSHRTSSYAGFCLNKKMRSATARKR